MWAGRGARGIEKTHIRLGTVQPGENIAVFNDALSALQTSSSFLYSDGSNNRFWYDTRPTLRKVMEDRAQQLGDSDVTYEIERRLKTLRKAAPFAGLHVCPASTLDVPDEMALRLVVLSPSAPHRGGAEDSAALKLANEPFLDAWNRGEALQEHARVRCMRRGLCECDAAGDTGLPGMAEHLQRPRAAEFGHGTAA